MHGEPSIAEVYNWRRNFPGAIVQPQPGDTPLAPGQSNVAGAIAFSTSYLPRARQPGLSWNATAELFVNLVDNLRLDKSHFIPVAMVTSPDGLDVLAQCYSYGRMADECDPPNATKCPGPDEVTLYAQGNRPLSSETSMSLRNALPPGNSYLDSLYRRMDYIISVDIYYAAAPAAQDGRCVFFFFEIARLFGTLNACNV